MGFPFFGIAPGTTCPDTGIMQLPRPNGMAFLSLDAHFSVEVIYFGRFKDLYFVHNGRTRERKAMKLRGRMQSKGLNPLCRRILYTSLNSLDISISITVKGSLIHCK
jgi:hypothetical protein